MTDFIYGPTIAVLPGFVRMLPPVCQFVSSLPIGLIVDLISEIHSILLKAAFHNQGTPWGHNSDNAIF